MTARFIVAAATFVCASGLAFAQGPLQGTSGPSAAPMATGNFGFPGADAMVGKAVVDKEGRPIGVVEDLVLGPAGQIRQLVVAPDGAANTAARLFAIDFTDVRMRSDSAHLHVPDLAAADVAALPAFEYGEGMTSLNRPAPGAPGGQPK